MKAVTCVLLVFVFACGKNETSSTVDLVKTIATESRTKPRVEISVKLGNEQPTPDDLTLQKSIEDRIEQAHIGRLVSSGSNSGFMIITVEVENSADAIAKLRTILQNAGVLTRSSFKVKTGD